MDALSTNYVNGLTPSRDTDTLDTVYTIRTYVGTVVPIVDQVRQDCYDFFFTIIIIMSLTRTSLHGYRHS